MTRILYAFDMKKKRYQIEKEPRVIFYQTKDGITNREEITLYWEVSGITSNDLIPGEEISGTLITTGAITTFELPILAENFNNVGKTMTITFYLDAGLTDSVVVFEFNIYRKGVFTTKDELQTAVDLWSGTSTDSAYSSMTPEEQQAEALALYGEINTWDVSSIDNMSHLFRDKTTFGSTARAERGINDDISNWNISSVTNMWAIFNGAEAFNQDISSWNTSSVTNMNNMFHHAYKFNQDISSWDVSSVANRQVCLCVHPHLIMEMMEIMEINH